MIVSTNNAIEKTMTRNSVDEVYDLLPVYEKHTGKGEQTTDKALSDVKAKPLNEKIPAPPAYTETSGSKKSIFGFLKSRSKPARQPAFATMEASGMTPILMPDMPSGLASAWKPRPATAEVTKAERVRAGPRLDRPEIDLAVSLVAGQTISQITVAPLSKKTKAEKIRAAPRYERPGVDLAVAIARGTEGLDAKR